MRAYLLLCGSWMLARAVALLSLSGQTVCCCRLWGAKHRIVPLVDSLKCVIR
jgi:hypothetical protein